MPDIDESQARTVSGGAAARFVAPDGTVLGSPHGENHGQLAQLMLGYRSRGGRDDELAAIGILLAAGYVRLERSDASFSVQIESPITAAQLRTMSRLHLQGARVPRPVFFDVVSQDGRAYFKTGTWDDLMTILRDVGYLPADTAAPAYAHRPLNRSVFAGVGSDATAASFIDDQGRLLTRAGSRVAEDHQDLAADALGYGQDENGEEAVLELQDRFHFIRTGGYEHGGEVYLSLAHRPTASQLAAIRRYLDDMQASSVAIDISRGNRIIASRAYMTPREALQMLRDTDYDRTKPRASWLLETMFAPLW